MIDEIEGGVRIRLLIQPKSSKNEIVGPHDGALKVRLQAPPIEGRANEALIEFLAGLLGLPKRAVSIARGQTGRRKSVEVTGVSVSEVRSRLGFPP